MRSTQPLSAKGRRFIKARLTRALLEALETRTLLTAFTVTTTDDSGAGSFRQAILDSNAATGQTNSIAFNLAGSGVQTLTPLTALPAVTNPVVIDATTMTGFAGAPLFEINFNDTLTQGLEISAGNTTLRGIAISGLGSGDLITLDTAGNDVIAGNYIGTTSDGTAASLAQSSNTSGAGIRISGAACTNNTIGGTDAADRNIISGNGADGIAIDTGSSGNLVEGNYIGTDVTGANAVPNLGNGISVAGGHNTIGGGSAGAGNIITGNLGNGILIQANAGTPSASTVISNDLIGLAAGSDLPTQTVTSLLPNGLDGIRSASDQNTAITNTSIGYGLDENGWQVDSGPGDTFTGGGFATVENQSVGSKPISRTVAEPLPAATSAVLDEVSDGVTVNGTFHGAARKTYTFQIYGQHAIVGGSFTGPILVDLGQFTVKTNASGNFTFSSEVLQSFFVTRSVGDQVAITATAAADTSEFSTVTPLLRAVDTTHLVFTQQPSTTVAGVKMAPALTVSVEDSNAAVITSNHAKISITLQGTSTTSKVTTLSAVAVHGVATFKNIVINKTGSDSFHATATGISSATSTGFNITPAATKKMTITTQPPLTIAAGATFNVTLTLFDKFGNIATTDGSTVTVSLGSHPTGGAVTPQTVNVTNGLASFVNLSLTPPNSHKFSLKFKDSVLGGAGVTSRLILVT